MSKPEVVTVAEQLGHAIRVQRVRLRLTQHELAERAGVERTYVSDLERGVRAPGLEMIARLSTALECSLSELFAGIKVPPHKGRLRQKKSG